MTENLGSELNVRAPTLNTVTSATRIQVTMYESARSFALIMLVLIMVLVRFADMTMYDGFGASAVIFSCNKI